MAYFHLVFWIANDGIICIIQSICIMVEIKITELDALNLIFVHTSYQPFLGSEVNVLREAMILNSVVLPYKELNASYRNQIIL